MGRDPNGLDRFGNPKPPAIRWGSFLLGDAVEGALSKVGITKERVEKLLQRRCRCPERQAFLNRVGLWAQRVLGGKTDDADKYLEEITSEYEESIKETEKGKPVPRKFPHARP